MKSDKIKKIGSIILIITGSVLLITEIASKQKNYYIQSVGIVCLMLGVFLINSKLRSKSDIDIEDNIEE